MRVRGIAVCVLALIVGACSSSNDPSSNADADGSTTSTVDTSATLDIVTGSGTLTAARGGILVSDDGLFALYVPPGAIAKDTEFKVAEVASADLAGPFKGAPIHGAVHGVEPTGLTFTKPALVLRSVDTKAAGLAQTTAPLVNLVSASGNTFDVLGNQVVVDYGSQVLIAATTTHLTQFLALGDTTTKVSTEELERVPLTRDLAGVLAATPGMQVRTTDAPVTGAALQNTVGAILPADSLHDGALPRVDMLSLSTILRANRFDQAHNSFYDYFANRLPNEIDQGTLDGVDVVDVSNLGGPSYCDRAAFRGRQGLAVMPIIIKQPSGTLMYPLQLPRPRTTVFDPVWFDCRTSPTPTPSTGSSALTLTGAQACVIHTRMGAFPSHIMIRSQYSAMLDSLALTLSNGANGGQPVVQASTDHSVETNLGIPAYGSYDVVKAVANGTNGDTVDLTQAFQAALGSMQVGPTEGALGKTPAGACN